jgi:transcriptional regulator
MFYLTMHRKAMYRQAMSKPAETSREILPGTLDLLILKTLSRGPLHGYGIAQHLHAVSDEVLSVGEGSLYPALQRLLGREWVKAEWGTTETGRKARIYRLTPAGRKQLVVETASFTRMMQAIQAVLAA